MEGFKIINKIGEGTYSSVYIVKRLEDSKLYALKKVKINSLSYKEKINALNEIRILASVKSPFVISYKESFIDECDKTLCIIMEYADDGDLFQKITSFLKSKSTFTEEKIWKIFLQICKGLNDLHRYGILHRDLKSANVFLFKDGSAKLGDLNVSKIASRGLGCTQTGTPYYASPEVWRDIPYDLKSDIWSLGCIAYELCMLKTPFRAQTMDGLYKKIMKGEYPKINKQYSKELDLVIASMLKVKVEERPNTNQILNMEEVKEKIEEYGVFNGYYGGKYDSNKSDKFSNNVSFNGINYGKEINSSFCSSNNQGSTKKSIKKTKEISKERSNGTLISNDVNGSCISNNLSVSNLVSKTIKNNNSNELLITNLEDKFKENINNSGSKLKREGESKVSLCSNQNDSGCLDNNNNNSNIYNSSSIIIKDSSENNSLLYINKSANFNQKEIEFLKMLDKNAQEFIHNQNEEKSIDIQTIRIPRKLISLNNKLPKPNYVDENRIKNFRAKSNMGFAIRNHHVSRLPELKLPNDSLKTNKNLNMNNNGYNDNDKENKVYRRNNINKNSNNINPSKSLDSKYKYKYKGPGYFNTLKLKVRKNIPFNRYEKIDIIVEEDEENLENMNKKLKSLNLMKNVNNIYGQFIPKIYTVNGNNLDYKLNEETILGNLNYSMNKDLLKGVGLNTQTTSSCLLSNALNKRSDNKELLLPIIRYK